MEASASATGLDAFAPLLSRPADQVQLELERFCDLLRKWQRAKNLVSRETLDTLWPRHIIDSLQVLPLLRPDDRLVLDLGSGGGFPAIPLAIALKGRADFVLLEPNGRKASFLKTVARELDLPVTVHAERAESVAPETIGVPDVITSRALASLPTLMGFAAPFCGPSTRLVLHKGRASREELAESRLLWHYDSVNQSSVTDPEGVVLEITHLRKR